MTDLLAPWRAGETLRWHSHADARLRRSGDTDAGHSHRAAGLAWDLWPDRPQVARWLRAHDLGESAVGGGPGDVGGPVKDADPELARRLEALEEAALARLGVVVPVLTPEERAMARLCDKLDAVLWMLHHASDLQARPEWQRDLLEIEGLAAQLRVLGPVSIALQQAGAKWPVRIPARAEGSGLHGWTSIGGLAGLAGREATAWPATNTSAREPAAHSGDLA